MSERVIRIILRDDVPMFDESMGEQWFDMLSGFQDKSADYFVINPRNLDYLKFTLRDIDSVNKDIKFVIYKQT